MTFLTIGMYGMSPSAYFEAVRNKSKYYYHDEKMQVSRIDYIAFIKALTRCADILSKGSIDSDDNADEA